MSDVLVEGPVAKGGTMLNAIGYLIVTVAVVAVMLSL